MDIFLNDYLVLKLLGFSRAEVESERNKLLRKIHTRRLQANQINTLRRFVLPPAVSVFKISTITVKWTPNWQVNNTNALF